MTRKSLLLSRSEVADALSMDDVLEVVQRVYVEFGNGQVVQPDKITLDMSPMGLDAWHNAMPAYVHTMDAAGIKWAGGYAQNRNHGLPYVMAVIVLQEPATGYPLAVMDGSEITNMRTGAAAAVCAKLYACADSASIGFIGAGMQSRQTLDALMCLWPMQHVRVSDINADAAASFKQEIERRHDVSVEVTDAKGVAASDIIVTATFANEPLIFDDWVLPGATIVSLGSFQELEDECVLRMDRLAVDSWGQCSHRGELARLAEAGRIKESDVVSVCDTAAGKVAGRESDDERILVVPVGLGAHDVALARVVHDRVIEKSGMSLDFLA